MTAEIVKFPYDACRRVHSQNRGGQRTVRLRGKGEKVAALETPPGRRLSCRAREHRRSQRSIAGSRQSVARLHRCDLVLCNSGREDDTAGLRVNRLLIQSEIRKEWLESLTARFETCTWQPGLAQAMNTRRRCSRKIPTFR